MDCQILLTGAIALLLWTAAEGAATVVPLYLQNSALDPIAARNKQNIAYYGTFTLGTPGTDFTGCFDTGSSDTWLPSSYCTASACVSHDQYNPASSSSYVETEQSFELTYGTGAVEGYVSFDTMSLGTPPITISNQGFGQAIDLTPDFVTTSCDGLFGLAFPVLSDLGVYPPFFNMLQDNALSQPLFTVWLDPSPYAEPAGQLTFGETDPTRYTGDIQYLDVSDEAYWQVNLDSVSYGSTDVGIGATQAILDSGTTAIVASTRDARLINEQLPGAVYWNEAEAWNISCSSVSSLDPVTFTLNGISFSVPATLYVQQLTDISGNPLDACTSAIVGGGTQSMIVLGTNFLRAWYAVFSYDMSTGAAQIGLASAVGNSTISS